MSLPSIVRGSKPPFPTCEFAGLSCATRLELICKLGRAVYPRSAPGSAIMWFLPCLCLPAALAPTNLAHRRYRPGECLPFRVPSETN